MTLLQSSNDARVRGNIIVAIGDMSFRFPNLVEPWAKHMYTHTFVHRVLLLSHL
jgi:condensin complex subunit 1